MMVSDSNIGSMGLSKGHRPSYDFNSFFFPIFLLFKESFKIHSCTRYLISKSRLVVPNGEDEGCHSHEIFGCTGDSFGCHV